MPALLLICLPPVDMPAVDPCCWYARLAVDPCCQYACLLLVHLPPVNTPALLSIPAVNTPALLSIRLAVDPCCRYRQYTHLLSIHLHPYWYTCTRCCCCGLWCCRWVMTWWGHRCPHPSRRGGARNGTSTCLAWCKVHIRQWWDLGGTCRWWEEQWQVSNCIVTQVTRVTLSHNTLNWL